MKQYNRTKAKYIHEEHINSVLFYSVNVLHGICLPTHLLCVGILFSIPRIYPKTICQYTHRSLKFYQSNYKKEALCMIVSIYNI